MPRHTRPRLSVERLEPRDVPAAAVVRFEPATFQASEESGVAEAAVVLSQPLTVPVDVTVRTDGRTEKRAATPGADYVPVLETVTFMPGQTRQTVTVPVLWDAAAEADESVILRLGIVSTAQIVVAAPEPARLTIRDSRRDPARTVVIDNAWLNDPANLARPGDRTGPYKLGQAGKTYILDIDVSRPGSAFVATAPGVTLHLNGHTVTYDSGDYNGDGAGDLAALTNGGFEVPRPDDATRPANWDLTAAPAARLGPSRLGMWGAAVLHFENITTPQTLVSAPVTLPTDAAGAVLPREYAAAITPKTDKGDVTVTVAVLDDATGATLATATSGTGDTPRGYSPVAQFVPGAATRRVRLRVDVVPLNGKMATVDLDGAALTASRSFGVMASQGYASVPADLRAVAGYATAADFTIRAGTVNQGAARSFRGSPLFFQSLPRLTVDGVNTRAAGMDADNLSADNAADVTVRNSTFDADIDRLSRRTVGYAAIHLNNVREAISVVNNDIRNAPMFGVYLANADTTEAVVNEKFTPAGTLPAGWSQRGGPFAVAAPPKLAFSTNGNALTFDPSGDATRSALAWTTGADADDTVVAADVYVNSTAPSLVLARGSNLDTNAPNYYAAAVSKTADGRLLVRLLRTVNGVTSTIVLGGVYTGQPVPVVAVTSPDVFADGWVRVTFEVWGPTLRVRVQRLDNQTYLKAAVNATTGAITLNWAGGDNDSWAVQAQPATADRLTGGRLAGVGRLAGDGLAKAAFDNFTANRFAGTRAVIAGNDIRQRAVVADGYGILVNGVTGFDVSDNVIQPVNGRGILLEGADPSNPTRAGTIRDNWVEARETYNLEYSSANLEATALRVRNFDAHFRGLHVTDNVFLAETDTQHVKAAIAARISLDNSLGQTTDADILFENNVFLALAHTADPAFQATALAIPAAASGTGLAFRGNLFESNGRTLMLGERADSYGASVKDVLLTGDTFRRSADAPSRADFQTVFVGEGANIVSGVRIIDWRLENGAPAVPVFAATLMPKAISIGRTATVIVLTGGGAPAVGIPVRIEDRDGQSVFTGTTDAAGRVAVPVDLILYRQSGTGPVQADARGPFRVVIRAGATAGDIRGGVTFEGDGVVTFTVVE